jgi:hypothetical protein
LTRPPAGSGPAPSALPRDVIAARAADVLRSNDVGTMTTAAPLLYPHMWSWDAAFISVGLASVKVDRAMVELDTLLAAQWETGMIPHIVFSPRADTYFPGPERWECGRLAAAAPTTPETSGICQPPVHALAVQRIVDAAETQGLDDPGAEFLDRTWPRLVRWHRWLASARDPESVGRITIHHGWESGMDNSPRWDAPYSRVVVGADLPPYERKDIEFVVDPAERPTDEEYARYLWLVEEMRRVRYDDAEVRRVASFAVEDVFFTAVLAVACETLADLGTTRGMPAAEVQEQRDLAERFRRGVWDTVDDTGLARDRDLRTGEWLAADTVARFAPLLCGGNREAERRVLEIFASEDWCGHPDFVASLPPSTSPSSPQFRPEGYWRGPQWPVIAWLFSWALRRHGWPEPAERLAHDGLALLSRGHFGEYYQPFSGAPLGSHHQSWTAAVALDWLEHVG